MGECTRLTRIKKGKRRDSIISPRQGPQHSGRQDLIHLAMNCMNAINVNIWIYSHDVRDPDKQLLAQQLIATVRPLALPWQVGCEFIAACRKLAASGFDDTMAWSALGDMKAMANVILLPTPRTVAGNSGQAGSALAFLLGCVVGQRLYSRWSSNPVHRGYGCPSRNRRLVSRQSFPGQSISVNKLRRWERTGPPLNAGICSACCSRAKEG